MSMRMLFVSLPLLLTVFLFAMVPSSMAAKAVHGLTVVISPLQSLMKDQMDNLCMYLD